MTTLSAIVAATQDGIIGRDGTMPWRLSTDLRRFKRLTLGWPMLMGRKTYDSIGRALPGRTTCVLTRQTDWNADGVAVVHSVDAALGRLRESENAFIVGGAEIYRLMMPYCDRILMTRVWSRVPGDTRLEGIDFADFAMTYVERIPVGVKDEYPSEFQVWQRVSTNNP